MISFTRRTNEMKPTIAPAYCRQISPSARDREPRQSPGVSLSWEDKSGTLGRPREQAFVGQSVLEERAVQRERGGEGSGDWRCPLCILARVLVSAQGGGNYLKLEKERGFQKAPARRGVVCWVEDAKTFCLTSSEINPKLNAALDPPNHSKQDQSGSNCF